MTNNENGLLDFLKTKRTIEELKLCLDILKEFKSCESYSEFCFSSFESWQRFEQFEDYLKLLTNTDVDEVEDDKAKLFLKQKDFI